MANWRRLFGALALACICPVPIATAQQQSNADLRKDVDALKAGVAAIQKELQEIKTLLQTRLPDQTGKGQGQGPERQADAEVLALLGEELSRTRRLGTVTITNVKGVEDGAIRIELRPDQGDAFQFEILKKDPAGPPGIAETGTLSIYLISAPGSRTLDYQALAAQELAKRLAAEEARGVKVPALKSMRERSKG